MISIASSDGRVFFDPVETPVGTLWVEVSETDNMDTNDDDAKTDTRIDSQTQMQTQADTQTQPHARAHTDHMKACLRAHICAYAGGWTGYRTLGEGAGLVRWDDRCLIFVSSLTQGWRSGYLGLAKHIAKSVCMRQGPYNALSRIPVERLSAGMSGGI